jgi:hypothetical protein
MKEDGRYEAIIDGYFERLKEREVKERADVLTTALVVYISE